MTASDVDSEFIPSYRAANPLRFCLATTSRGNRSNQSGCLGQSLGVGIPSLPAKAAPDPDSYRARQVQPRIKYRKRSTGIGTPKAREISNLAFHSEPLSCLCISCRGIAVPNGVARARQSITAACPAFHQSLLVAACLRSQRTGRPPVWFVQTFCMPFHEHP